MARLRFAPSGLLAAAVNDQTDRAAGRDGVVYSKDAARGTVLALDGARGRALRQSSGASVLKDQARRCAVGEQPPLLVRDPAFGRADTAAATQDNARRADQACFHRDRPHE
jgi:hypothetical protein